MPNVTAMEDQIQDVYNDIDTVKRNIATYQRDHDELVRFSHAVAGDLSTCLEPQVAAKQMLQAVMVDQDCDERLLSFIKARRTMLQMRSIMLKNTMWLNAAYTLKLSTLSKLQTLSQETRSTGAESPMRETEDELQRALEQIKAEIAGMVDQIGSQREMLEVVEKQDIIDRDWLVQRCTGG